MRTMKWWLAMYNIAKADGTLMMSLWVQRRKDVKFHLLAFQKAYRGEEFRIVDEHEYMLLRAQVELDKAFYQLGRLPPRYPVPAIIYDVYLQVTPDYPTAIWERTGTQYYYNKRVYVYNAT